MRETEVAIIGGGLAGSTAAFMLGQAGVSTVLIDPHDRCPPAFRCEKLDKSQLHLLGLTGLADAVVSAATSFDEIWVARSGLLTKRRTHQVGVFYDDLVNIIRAQIREPAEIIRATASSITTSAERQTVSLSTGEQISARLVVVASGLSDAVRRMLGIGREELSACHSISIGFNVEPVGRPSFSFPALTYFPRSAADQMAYLSFFPIGSAMRANLFVYRTRGDPWLRQLREAPEETLLGAMPHLGRLLGAFRVTDQIKVRPVDLYVAREYRKPGVVLVGDAFATSCPAAGTGLNKVFTDVERLCNIYIPRWLATDGMGPEKIAGFYEDPMKVECDSHSVGKAFYLHSLSTKASLAWRLRRWSKILIQFGIGALTRAQASLGGLGHRLLPR